MLFTEMINLFIKTWSCWTCETTVKRKQV